MTTRLLKILFYFCNIVANTNTILYIVAAHSRVNGKRKGKLYVAAEEDMLESCANAHVT